MAILKVEKQNKKLLGETLIEKKIIQSQQLNEALKIQTKKRELLGKILIELGYITEEDIARSIAETYNLPYIELDVSNIQAEAVKYIPEALVHRYNIIPTKIEGVTLYLACDKPLPGQIVGNLQRVSGKQIALYIATSSSIKGLRENITGTSTTSLEEESIDQSIIDILSKLIVKASGQRASDIHLEPGENRLQVRFRIDGMLYKEDSFSLDLAPPLISRIKILSELNIAEKRAPQDGSFVFDDTSESVDIRVSILPNIHGEKAVLRLLPSKNRKITLKTLGMEDHALKTFETLLKRPHGIILITGPTGSGKSTTLYASLLLLRSTSANITTIEDPVEYQIEGITQTQVDQINKITFPKALRAILRQDPDIIMVGEIRDKETADIALRAALTGHLVLATLHTNDAPSALTRLVDMGCEPYLISSSVCGILAQRLVRVNCEFCKEQFIPTPDELVKLKISALSGEKKWFRGKGCRHCQKTGYSGRIGVFELLDINTSIQQEIIKQSSAEVIRKIAISEGMRTLYQDSILKVQQGLTTPEEVLRVTVLE